MQRSVLDGWRWREVLIVLGLAATLVLLSRIPVFGLVFYPFRLFGTFVHEICHGLAAILTGGEFQRFAVNPNLSGVAFSRGGISWIIASAGYVGSTLFGGLLLVISARGVSARRVLMGLGIVLGLLCLLFVRNLFGLLAGAVLAAALVLAAQRLPARWAAGLLLLLAVQMMLDSVGSVLDLVQLSATTGVTTDAAIMARATGIPAIFWAVVWTGLSLVTLAWSLQLAYGRAHSVSTA